jgi:hypothetical protein
MSVLSLLFAVLVCPPARASDFDSKIDAAMKRVARLEYMDMQKKYELPVHGKTLRADGIDFVDRRTAKEVLDSNLSTGCGDSAGAFYELLKPAGYEMLFLQSADISVANLLDFVSAGHTGVAVREPESGKWLLADPTNRKILSRDWDPKSKLYGRRWIGYIGQPEGYYSQITAENGVGEFFLRTLKTVPASVLNEQIVGLDFVLEPGFENREARKFALMHSGLYERLGIKPKHRVTIRLAEGSSQGIRCHTEGKEFFCDVGRRNHLGDRDFTWIEESAVEHAPAARD